MHAFTGMGPAAGLFFWAWCLLESVPWALLGPATLLLAAAATGAAQQIRLVVLRS